MAAEDGVTEAPEAHAAAADAPEMEEDEGERAADGEGLGNALPVARVKRIMRKNPDKKKNFSKDTVLAVSMATELFLNDIVVKSHENTSAKRRKTMQLQDIAWSIQNEARYEFLDGPGILPMDYDKKPVKIESAQAKEAKSDVRAEENAEKAEEVGATAAAEVDAIKDDGAMAQEQAANEASTSKVATAHQEITTGDESASGASASKSAGAGAMGEGAKSAQGLGLERPELADQAVMETE
eukprot:Tamp_23312.p1 GENE.Tamp_23312~~Tamp_23312.p1  ORF type:complete len:249 (+),score=84.55 Tamp_23312:28-747(+)